MLVAAVLDETETILPIIEGEILRIYNTESREKEDFINPASETREGGRMETLLFAEEKGAIIFAAPPHTFCYLTYKKAQDDRVKFYRIAANTSFNSFEQSIQKEEIIVQIFLPEEEIVANKSLF